MVTIVDPAHVSPNRLVHPTARCCSLSLQPGPRSIRSPDDLAAPALFQVQELVLCVIALFIPTPAAAVSPSDDAKSCLTARWTPSSESFCEFGFPHVYVSSRN